jgi:hypothetical protein
MLVNTTRLTSKNHRQMREQINSATIVSKLIFIFLVSLILQSCVPTNKIIEENDIVYSNKKITLKYYCKDQSKESPLQYVEQSIVKEIQLNNATTYKVYDILTLTSSSFMLQNRVFLILDNEIYPMTLENIENENSKSITENRSNILNSDSTSVVTEYSENNKKVTRFGYKLSDEIINKIKISNQVQFRYYSGPSMLTIKLNEKNLRKLKFLIDKT